MNAQRAIAGIASVCLLVVAGCGEPTRPKPVVAGWLDVRVSTSAPDVGIVRMTLAGGRVDSATVSGVYSGFIGAPQGGAVPLIVIGPIATGSVARIKVPDLSVPYTAIVEEAASSSDYSLIATDQFVAAVLPIAGHASAP